MPNNCLTVLHKHIIQVENKIVGLNVGGGGGGTNIPLPHPSQKIWIKYGSQRIAKGFLQESATY